MKNHSQRLISLAVAAALGAPLAAHATNGMNLEGYGPIASGMGGASMAYDNGTAAVMNNPATLGLMEAGTSRLDIALGNLRPDVSIDTPSPANWDSGSNSFIMPAVGWAKSDGNMTYGVGVFAQGGMGTEYDNSGMYGASPGGAMSAGEAATNIANLDGMVTAGLVAAHVSVDQLMGGTATLTDYANTVGGTAAMTMERSEVSVGRLVAPLVFNVNSKLKVGGSLDFVWAGMDLQMAMPGSMMSDMMMGSQSAGTITGGMVGAMGSMFFDPATHNFNGAAGAPAPTAFGISGMNYGYFDFTDSSPYTGKALGKGFAGKLGFTYQVSPTLTIGGTYHSKTSMSDLETTSGNVNMSVLMSSVETGSNSLVTMASDIEMNGTIKVNNFQWPSTYGLGMSLQATDALMIAADIKRVNWSGVMSDFSLSFDADKIMMGGMDMTAMFTGATDMDANMYQNWDDQTVIQIGAAYAMNADTVVRLGMNRSSQPIPESTLHYLFPAITENHYTFGVGHAMSGHQDVNFALSYVPEATVDSPMGFSANMKQMNWQLMYSHKF